MERHQPRPKISHSRRSRWACRCCPLRTSLEMFHPDVSIRFQLLQFHQCFLIFSWLGDNVHARNSECRECWLTWGPQYPGLWGPWHVFQVWCWLGSLLMLCTTIKTPEAKKSKHTVRILWEITSLLFVSTNIDYIQRQLDHPCTCAIRVRRRSETLLTKQKFDDASIRWVDGFRWLCYSILYFGIW